MVLIFGKKHLSAVMILCPGIIHFMDIEYQLIYHASLIKSAFHLTHDICNSESEKQLLKAVKLFIIEHI